jgi:hypothetical protein
LEHEVEFNTESSFSTHRHSPLLAPLCVDAVFVLGHHGGGGWEEDEDDAEGIMETMKVPAVLRTCSMNCFYGGKLT